MKLNLKAPLAPALLGAVMALGAGPALAQEGAASDSIVIRNARILDGTGNRIENGTILVRDGRIVSVGAEDIEAEGAQVIDAQGLTAMPGYIDAHRHLISGDPQTWLEQDAERELQEFLEAGFTTVREAIGNFEIEIPLRERIAAGEVIGPRLLVAGFVPVAAGGPMGEDDPARTDVSRPPLRPTEPAQGIPDEAILAMMAQAAEAGVNGFKSVITVTPGGPEQDTLTVIAQEAKRLGLPSLTHAVTVQDTMAALETGTDVLMHTPHIEQLTEEQAQMIADAGVPVVSTLGVFIPFFDEENQPIFRDALPFPWDTISSAGQGPVNARLLWEAGVPYAFGTDTSFHPSRTLKHELKGLNLVFSERDIIEILTRNSAIAVGLEDDLGTLEEGKLADIVLLDGNPLEEIHDLLKVVVVLKEGDIVVDKR